MIQSLSASFFPLFDKLLGKLVHTMSTLFSFPLSLLEFGCFSFSFSDTTVSFRSNFYIAKGSEHLSCSSCCPLWSLCDTLPFWNSSSDLFFFSSSFSSSAPLAIKYLQSAYWSPLNLEFPRVQCWYLCSSFCITHPPPHWLLSWLQLPLRYTDVTYDLLSNCLQH